MKEPLYPYIHNSEAYEISEDVFSPLKYKDKGREICRKTFSRGCIDSKFINKNDISS